MLPPLIMPNANFTQQASDTIVKLKLTSRMILTASRVFPSFRAHIANRRLMYTRMFVSRPAFYIHIMTFSLTHNPVFYNHVISSSTTTTMTAAATVMAAATTTATNTILRPLYNSLPAPQKILLEQSFTACTLLITATSAFGLGRGC